MVGAPQLNWLTVALYSASASQFGYQFSKVSAVAFSSSQSVPTKVDQSAALWVSHSVDELAGVPQLF